MIYKLSILIGASLTLILFLPLFSGCTTSSLEPEDLAPTYISDFNFRSSGNMPEPMVWPNEEEELWIHFNPRSNTKFSTEVDDLTIMIMKFSDEDSAKVVFEAFPRISPNIEVYNQLCKYQCTSIGEATIHCRYKNFVIVSDTVPVDNYNFNEEVLKDASIRGVEAVFQKIPA